MKKSLLVLFVLCCVSGAFAQNCMRDSSLLTSGKLLSPAYWDTVTMEYNLKIACVSMPYSQSVTVNVPSTYSGFNLVNVSVPTTGAITNLPAGLSYSCDPPNCVFNALTLGCIQLFGTPTAANAAPDTLDLGIMTNITTTAFPFPIPVTFPSGIPGNNHYYLILKDANCLVGTYDHHSSIGYVSSAPNPFSSETTITVESIVAGDFQFEVFNLLGERVHNRNLHLDAGVQEFNFDGSALPNGSYIYTLGNREGKLSRKLMVAR